MNLITKILCPLLSISLILPISVYADNGNDIQQRARQAEKAGIQAVLNLKKAGTEFYLDAEKKHATDLRDLRPDKNGTIRFYTVTPFDKQLNSPVAVAQTLSLKKSGQVGLTVEILKNEPKKMIPYPIRAIKRIELGKSQAGDIRVQLTRSIQAALAIAQNQMEIGTRSSSKIEKIASAISNLILPSAHAEPGAHADLISMTVLIVTGAFGAIMLLGGAMLFILIVFGGFAIGEFDTFTITAFAVSNILMISGATLTHVFFDYLDQYEYLRR